GNTWSLIGINGGAAHGSVTMYSDGSYTYTPAQYYFGTDIFNYHVCDGDGDCSSATVTITIPQPKCTTDVTGIATDITCNGSHNGAIDITVTGNNGIVSYAWNDGNTDEDRTGLPTGTYSVTIKDETLCSATQSFIINEPDALNVSASQANVTTAGGTNGSIDITVTGGTKQYTYAWNNGSTDEDASGLAAGTYSVIVKDAHGCATGGTYILTQPDCNFKISGKITNACCYGSNTGAIDITVSGNNGLVSYLWNDNVTSANRTDLIAGKYSVTATDATGCVASEIFAVKQAKKIKVTSTITNAGGKNSCDGSASLSASGGNAPYTYTWNDGFVGASRNNLCKGLYTVTVEDARSCTAVIKIKVLYGSSQLTSTNTQDMSINEPVTISGVSVSPNPVKDIVKIIINAVHPDNASIMLFDLSGKLMASDKINLITGKNIKTMNFGSYTEGIYILKVISDNKVRTFKILLQ
ncbi:MAG TPA: T9SS type A sorting domain-containing protein, partial [Chitinophagaceae bacterium]